MADSSISLLTIPLELRHQIIGYVSQRKHGPDHIIRKWYDALEAKQNAPPAANVVVEDEEDEEAEEMEEDGGEDEDEDEDGDGNEDDDDDDGGNQATVGTTAATTAVFATGKWRHVPTIMRLSHSPPPLSLLQTCDQLRREALDYYYDVTALTIDATASFVHQTYFEEEVFDKLCAAAFSPLEQIRLVNVNFVWDTAWITSEAGEGLILAIWEYELFSRARKVRELLYRAPQLRKVNILWHDSDNSPESISFQAEVTAILDELLLDKPHVEMKLTVKREEDSAAVEQNTVMGKKRLEFQQILSGGQNFR